MKKFLGKAVLSAVLVSALPQVAQARCPPSRKVSKAAADWNQLSKLCPCLHMSE